MSSVFWGTLFAILLLDLSVVGTLLVPSVQVWPPPRRQCWQYWFTWTLFVLAFAGVLVVGGLDVGSLGVARWLGEAGTHILGSTIFVLGVMTATYPMGYIGRRAALGLEDELVTDGPYALSRNPAYVGDLTMMAGYTLLSDSRLVGILALVAVLWFVFAAFTEESWLEDRYGEPYLQYKRKHPRWLL